MNDNKNLCPGCGETFPRDETVWIAKGQFYCSEACCRQAAMNG